MEKLQWCGLGGIKMRERQRERERETIVDMLAVTAVMSGLAELEHHTSRAI